MGRREANIQLARTASAPDGRATAQRTRRLGVVALVLTGLIILGLLVILTVFISAVAMPILSQGFAAAPTSTTASWIATQEAALTPTSADWATFTNSEGGFQVDVPGVISSSHAYFINDFSGKGSDFYYTGAPLSSPLQQREAKLWVKVLYSARITDMNICPQGGTAVKIGSGKLQIPAWQRDEGRIVALNLVLNGVAIQITLDSRDDGQPALARYDDIWRHMLASFAPLPGVRSLTTRPCG